MDKLNFIIEGIEKTPQGRAVLGDIRDLREEFGKAPRHFVGGPPGVRMGKMRMIGSVPENVMEAIRALYPEEMKDPKFWRWFFRKYPQFRVR